MHGRIGIGHIAESIQDSGCGTYPQRFRMEKPDAGGGKLHVLKKSFSGKVRKLWH